MIMHTVAFIDNLKNDSYEEEKSKFANSVNVINHQATFYLDNSKRIVRDWAQLVRLNDWTDSEIIENLSKQNSDDRIMITVLNADDLDGIAPQSDDDISGNARIVAETEEANYSVNYTLATELKAFRENANPGDVYVTSNFTNVISGEQCISFVSVVSVRNDDGTHRDAYLMRVEPISILGENWYFSTTYENAQICMINSFGEYIYRSPMFKNSNFYDFLMSYNDITYPEANKIKENINKSTDVGDFTMKNATGDETIYAYSTNSYNDWVIIGALKTNDLNYTQVQWALLVSPFLLSLPFLLSISFTSRHSTESSRKVLKSSKRQTPQKHSSFLQ